MTTKRILKELKQYLKPVQVAEMELNLALKGSIVMILCLADEQEIKFYKEAAKLLAKEAIRLARENLSFTIGSTLPMTNQEILDQLFKPKDSNEQKAE